MDIKNKDDKIIYIGMYNTVDSADEYASTLKQDYTHLIMATIGDDDCIKCGNRWIEYEEYLKKE